MAKNENLEYAKYRTTVEEMLPVMNEVIEAGGTFRFYPRGRSMKPFIRPGQDIVNVAALNQPEKYDIVLYRRDNGQMVLHRIIGMDENGYILCGDNQWRKEYGITRDMMLAKVVQITRGKKVIDCDSKKYMLCTHLWCDLFWLRKQYLRVRSVGSRIKRKIKK